MARAVPLSDKLRRLALRRFAQQLSVDQCYAARFAGVSTPEFLASRGFSATVIDGFFAPFYGGILLDRTLATTASVLLFTFKMLAEGDTVVPAAGMGALTKQLAAQLPMGSVHTGVAVQSLTVHEGRVTGVLLDGGEVMPAAQVIMATDAPAAARLAATAGVQIATPSGARGTTTLYFTTSGTSPIPGRALWLNADAAAVISHALTITDVAEESAPHGVSLSAVSAVGEAADRSDADLESAARRELVAMSRAVGRTLRGPCCNLTDVRFSHALLRSSSRRPVWRPRRQFLDTVRAIARRADAQCRKQDAAQVIAVNPFLPLFGYF